MSLLPPRPSWARQRDASSNEHASQDVLHGERVARMIKPVYRDVRVNQGKRP